MTKSMAMSKSKSRARKGSSRQKAGTAKRRVRGLQGEGRYRSSYKHRVDYEAEALLEQSYSGKRCYGLLDGRRVYKYFSFPHDVPVIGKSVEKLESDERYLRPIPYGVDENGKPIIAVAPTGRLVLDVMDLRWKYLLDNARVIGDMCRQYRVTFLDRLKRELAAALQAKDSRTVRALEKQIAEVQAITPVTERHSRKWGLWTKAERREYIKYITYWSVRREISMTKPFRNKLYGITSGQDVHIDKEDLNIEVQWQYGDPADQSDESRYELPTGVAYDSMGMPVEFTSRKFTTAEVVDILREHFRKQHKNALIRAYNDPRYNDSQKGGWRLKYDQPMLPVNKPIKDWSEYQNHPPSPDWLDQKCMWRWWTETHSRFVANKEQLSPPPKKANKGQGFCVTQVMEYKMKIEKLARFTRRICLWRPLRLSALAPGIISALSELMRNYYRKEWGLMWPHFSIMYALKYDAPPELLYARLWGLIQALSFSTYRGHYLIETKKGLKLRHPGNRSQKGILRRIPPEFVRIFATTLYMAYADIRKNSPWDNNWKKGEVNAYTQERMWNDLYSFHSEAIWEGHRDMGTATPTTSDLSKAFSLPDVEEPPQVKGYVIRLIRTILRSIKRLQSPKVERYEKDTARTYARLGLEAQWIAPVWALDTMECFHSEYWRHIRSTRRYTNHYRKLSVLSA